jgi:hypothetical protein
LEPDFADNSYVSRDVTVAFLAIKTAIEASSHNVYGCLSITPLRSGGSS